MCLSLETCFHVLFWKKRQSYCHYIRFHLCKPLNNYLYTTKGFAKQKIGLFNGKKSVYVQQDSNPEPSKLEADILPTVPLKLVG